MLFDNSPIEKINNIFFCIHMFRIFNKKDIFFDIFKISPYFKIVNDFIHFLYRKIFSKRCFEKRSYFLPIYQPSFVFYQLFNKIVKNNIRHIQVLTYKNITKKCNVFYKKIKTIFPEKFKQFFYCIYFLKP